VIATPDRRLRVFVSSTLVELAAERAAAREAIESLRLTPVLFELGARPHPPRALYSAYLEQSDVFVGIYGESYGWVGPGMEISGLEAEYRLATDKPRLLYVKRDASHREQRLTEMLDRVTAEGAVSYRLFTDPDELRELLADDLAVLVSERFHTPAAEERGPPSSSERLPAAVDRFVGRSAELAALERQLVDRDVRLVTVLGPGGVGKTRIALEAARRVADTFADGVHFVGLASVVDMELVDDLIRERLEISGAAGRAPLDAVVDRLRKAEALLVLDNFEHVLAAAGSVARLLEECPRLTVLVTSRAVLRLKGEREFPLSPLSLPEDGVPGADGAASDAVELFLERAVAANPALTLTDEDRAAVAAICRRLDGLPLAIELAAAQVRVLPPRSLVDRLERRLTLSARGGYGYPGRQQTLRAAIDWSFDLLGPAEQTLLTRASVFRDGWTLDALAAVCQVDDALEQLATLVEHSLVVQEPAGGEPRFSMLETIREHAAEKLDERGETAATEDRHARFYLRLVEDAGARLLTQGHGSALALLDRDEGNIRAALSRLLEQGEAERVAEAGWSLLPYWSLRERISEGRRWLESAVETGALPESARARALAAVAGLAFWGSDHATAVRCAGEALDHLRTIGDDAGIALAQIPLGVVQTIAGDREAGTALLEDSRRRAEHAGAHWGATMSLLALIWALNAAGADAPLELYEEAVTRARALGHEAETLALGALGRRRALRGDVREAKEALSEALRRVLALDARLGISFYLDLLADLAATQGCDALAVRLSAAAEVAAAGVGTLVPPLGGDRAARLETLRERLGASEFAAEDRAGRDRSIEDAAAEALAWAEEASAEPVRETDAPVAPRARGG
jgi:predicted ATPase